MKTPKEWFAIEPSEWRGAKPEDFTEWLKAVQLDAWKQGMTDALAYVSWAKSLDIAFQEIAEARNSKQSI